MFTTAAFIFLLYGGVEIIGCNGAITALIFGITLGNIKLVQIPLLKKKFSHAFHGLNYKGKTFFSEIVFLLKTFFMFILVFPFN
jgi:hypothetical protein